MGKGNGLIFIIRANFFINKLNYYQITTLLDLVRKRKKKMDEEMNKRGAKWLVLLNSKTNL